MPIKYIKYIAKRMGKSLSFFRSYLFLLSTLILVIPKPTRTWRGRIIFSNLFQNCPEVYPATYIQDAADGITLWKKEPKISFHIPLKDFLAPLFFINLPTEYSTLESVIRTAFATFCSCCYSEVKDLQSLPVLQHLKVGLTITCHVKGKNKADFSSCYLVSNC